jgi:hypothetical protein
VRRNKKLSLLFCIYCWASAIYVMVQQCTAAWQQHK